MAHPHRKEASDAHNAKLRAMTTHYGLASGPANNITTPQERLKSEGPEANVGFGADSSAATARSDRPARRSIAANPVPTYKRGGRVKNPEELCEGGSTRSEGGVIQRARGGRAKHGKGATHVNVVVAPQGGGAPPMAGPPPALAALAAGAHPPMGGPPMLPPGPGGPPLMPPPGAGAPPPMMPRARGGKVMGDHPDASQDKDLIEKTLREEGLIRKAKGGGITMKAGAATGIGRLEKMGEHPPLHRGSLKPQEI